MRAVYRLRWLAVGFLLGLAFSALIRSEAFASPDTTAERPRFRPETATRAKQPTVRCIPPRMFILAQRLPDGTRKAVAMMFVPGTCK